MTRTLFTAASTFLVLSGCAAKDSGTSVTGTSTGPGTVTGTGTGVGTGTGTGTGTGVGTGTGTGVGTGTGTGSTSASTYDLTFAGSGYTPHDSNTIWFVLYNETTSTGSAVLTTATDGSGNLSESWTGALNTGDSYTLYWVADLDGDGACTTPPGDHGWSEAIAAVSGDVALTRNHDTNFESAVCTYVSP